MIFIMNMMNIKITYAPYHEAISRLKDVQWTRDIWKAHGADKDGYCDLQQEDGNHLQIVRLS